MRDSVKLSTDIYRPLDNKSHPVILYRTPYDKSKDNLGLGIRALLNAKGFVFIAQDCRGRFASEGVDSVFFTDGWGFLQDGYDTIEWIVQQSWCDGQVGMLGASAIGITSYRAAGATHPNLKAIVAIVAPSDFYHQVVFPGGEFRKALCENWIREQGSDYMIPYFLDLPYYGPIWETMNLHARSDDITAAIYHISGWYDCFSEGPIAEFNDLREKPQAGPQKLITGPWTHEATGSNSKVGELIYPKAAFNIYGIILSWLEYWLMDRDNGVMNEPDVQYYLMGDPRKIHEIGCQWIEANEWPPENALPQITYLHANGNLSLEAPGDSGKLSFTYDPNDPVPTLGGNNLTIKDGPYDQRAIGNRADVLEFESKVLDEPLRVEGVVKGQLYISSNCPDTDFTLKLVDVYPDGREMLVTDGIVRTRFRLGEIESDMSFLNPGEIVAITIELPPTAIAFNSGHRVKVCISSSNFPRYEINPNTASELYDLTEKQIATNTVYCSQSYPSAVIFPVVETETYVSDITSSIPSHILENNYPNPFNNKTTIPYKLSRFGWVELSIYNVTGQRLKKLVNEMQDRGWYTAVWDGRDENGMEVGSGLYFYQLHAEQMVLTKKLLFLR